MEAFSINASLFWFLLGVAFLVLEALTPGFFLMFFGLGAWVTSGLIFLLPLPQSVQWLIFLAVSVTTLLIFRKKIKVLFEGRLAKTDNLDDPLVRDQYVGREVVILKDVSLDQPGQAELNGSNWQARTADEAPLPAGRRARVTGLDGLTLIVTSISSGKPE